MIVHIIGKGPGFKDAPAPSENGEYQIWGTNDAMFYKKCDLLFHMHDLDTAESPQKLCAILAEQHGTPLFSLKEYSWLSNSKEYPLAEIIEKHGHKYFASSICYILAYAIYNGVTEVHTWGICFFSNHLDVEQRCAVEYWLGVATGRDINIHIHGKSALLRVGKENRLYGYEKIDYTNNYEPESNA